MTSEEFLLYFEISNHEISQLDDKIDFSCLS